MHNSLFRSWSIPLIIAMSSVGFGRGAVNANCDPPRKQASDPPPQKSGRMDVISVIGFIDFDGDGISDRQRLHEAIAADGARIDNEVDDSGVRRPANGKITPQTKILLVGKLIDPSTVTDPKERKVAERIVRHFHAMLAEARKAGVRAIALTRFTSYSSSGSRRASSPWLYGGWPPKPGSPKIGIYIRSRRLRPSKSSGQAIKEFSGKK